MDNILGLIFSKLGMLIGLLAVMAATYVYFQANKSNTAIEDISQLSQNIQSIYNGNPFTSVTNTVVTNGNMAPAHMTTGAGILNNPWNGTVTVNVNSGNASLFDITETNVPADGCVKVAQGLVYASLKINGAAIAMPADPGAVTAACAVAPNTLALTFSH